MSYTHVAVNVYEEARYPLGQDEYGEIQIDDLQEISAQSGSLGSYINHLNKTYLNSLITIITSSIIGVPSLAALICFVSIGRSFIHPYLAIFLIVFALGMLILGVLSSITTKSYLEKALLQLTEE